MKGIGLHVACHQPKCLELLRRLDKVVNLKQTPESRSHGEEGYEVAKQRARHIRDRQLLNGLFHNLADNTYHWLTFEYAQDEVIETGEVESNQEDDDLSWTRASELVTLYLRNLFVKSSRLKGPFSELCAIGSLLLCPWRACLQW